MNETQRVDQPTYAVPAQVLHNVVDGEMVLLDLASETYFGLDRVGADIVTRLTTQPIEDALAGLVHDYDVEPETLRRDVEALVERLYHAGLLERLDGGGG